MVEKVELIYNGTMKLPLLQKIEISTHDETEIATIIKKNNVGKIPTIFLFSELTIEKAKLAIKACETQFLKQKINPLFPYPSYILNEWNIDQSFFPILRNITDAPKHFVKKIKRVKKREQVLLDKVTTLSERINNHSVSDDLEYVTVKANDNKTLKDLCSEKSFYLELLMNLKNPQKGLEDKEV